MRDFYTAYYNAVAHSHAHATFCEFAYGKDLRQHGFMTMAQLDALLGVTRPQPGQRILDLGCGDGMIAEYISDATGASVTGLDFIPSAVAQACERTRAKAPRLDFVVGDLTQLALPVPAFDLLLSIDTIYFSNDYIDTLKRWKAHVCAGGQMALLYSCGVDPEHPKETFSAATLRPDRTELAEALGQLGLGFETLDFTAQDYELAQRKKYILEQLEPEFEAEGYRFLYENRLGEALGVMAAVECGLHARYLYHIRTK